MRTQSFGPNVSNGCGFRAGRRGGFQEVEIDTEHPVRPVGKTDPCTRMRRAPEIDLNLGRGSAVVGLPAGNQGALARIGDRAARQRRTDRRPAVGPVAAAPA